MNKIYLIIKSQWNNILTIGLLIYITFKPLLLDIIKLCDKHEGFISAGIWLVTVLIACIALQSWQNEFKAQKTYKIHKEACEFLFDFKFNLKYLYLDFYNDTKEQKKELNAIISETNKNFEDFCVRHLEKVQRLQLSLNQINEGHTVINGIAKLIELYFFDFSDTPNEIIQPVVKNLIPKGVDSKLYTYNFCQEYFSLMEDGTPNPKYEKLKTDIDNGLKFFEKKIQKFFK